MSKPTTYLQRHFLNLITALTKGPLAKSIQFDDRGACAALEGVRVYFYLDAPNKKFVLWSQLKGAEPDEIPLVYASLERYNLPHRRFDPEKDSQFSVGLFSRFGRAYDLEELKVSDLVTHILTFSKEAAAAQRHLTEALSLQREQDVLRAREGFL